MGGSGWWWWVVVFKLILVISFKLLNEEYETSHKMEKNHFYLNLILPWFSENIQRKHLTFQLSIFLLSFPSSVVFTLYAA